MTYPLTTNCNVQVTMGLATNMPNVPTENQTFSVTATQLYEVDANGDATTVPLGQSGPFILQVDAEYILCSSFTEGVCEVFQDDDVNGRAYSSTSIASHNAGASQVTLIATTSQSVGPIGVAVGQVLQLMFGVNGPFPVPCWGVPTDYTGTGTLTVGAQLTTGADTIAGLLDALGNPIPDGWSFPATVFIENSEILDIVSLNAYSAGAGQGFAWWQSSAAPIFSLSPTYLIMPDIPTSDPGIAGAFYSVAGVVNVSAG